jgi:hypothetical protein
VASGRCAGTPYYQGDAGTTKQSAREDSWDLADNFQVIIIAYRWH